jgi:hypothetical protein
VNLEGITHLIYVTMSIVNHHIRSIPPVHMPAPPNPKLPLQLPAACPRSHICLPTSLTSLPRPDLPPLSRPPKMTQHNISVIARLIECLLAMRLSARYISLTLISAAGAHGIRSNVDQKWGEQGRGLELRSLITLILLTAGGEELGDEMGGLADARSRQWSGRGSL